MNWTAKLSEIFVKKESLSLLTLVALFAWGILSFFATPKQYNPTIIAPAFQIVVDYPGATQSEVLEQVTKPLENALTDLHGVEDIYSVTTQGGQAVVNVNFYVGEDFDKAKISLSDKIQSDMINAPPGISRPQIRSVDSEDVPILSIALDSDLIDAVDLRKFAFKLRDRLRVIQGASRISVIGGRRRELSILIDPRVLAQKAIRLDQIEDSIAKNNLFLPSGLIKGKEQYTPVEAFGIVEAPSDIRDIIVIAHEMNAIKLGDLAKVEEQVVEVDDYVRHLKKVQEKVVERENVVLLSISKIRGTNISDVTEAVNQSLGHLRSGFIPPEIHAEVIVDEGSVAKEEIDSLVMNLITSVIIVVVVLLLFLDLKAALVVAVAIPLTLTSVFGIAQLSGQNINRITLFALILSLGLLVDNATVIVENIVRRLKLKKANEGKDDLIIASVGEVGPGLFMSTITTVLAFVPMIFVTGMMGPYMGPIPFFVPAALIVSLLLSFTLNPWMAYRFLDVESTPSKWSWPFMSKLGRLFMQRYELWLGKLIENRKNRNIFLLTILAAVVLVSALPAFQLVKFRMLPKADKKQFFLYVDLPAGSPLDKTLQVAKKLEEYLLKEQSVTMVQSYVGHPPIMDFNGLFRGVEARRFAHQATMRIGLVDPAKRDRKSEDLVLAWRPLINAKIKKDFPDLEIKLKLVEDPPGPPVLSTLLLRVQGQDIDFLKKVSADISPVIYGIDQVVDTDTSVPQATTTLEIKVRHSLASMMRVTPYEIVATLNSYYSGKIVGIYHSGDNIEDEKIMIRLEKNFRLTREGLSQIYLQNTLRNPVSLSQLVDILEVETVTPIRRENRMNTVYIYGDMAKRSITYAAIDLLKFLYDYRLPDGKGELVKFSLFGASYRSASGQEMEISFGGEWELTLEVFRDLGLAMLVAIFLIYFVLVAQFGSFSESILIISTIPLGAIGVLPGFMILGWSSGIYFTATSMIGMIALAGIAVNNAILLLEYVNDEKKRGSPINRALYDACLVRFRPIMLTTATTLLGSLTIINDPVWAGLAFSLLFGLGMSTVLTLLVFPALYMVMIKSS
ncbi:MAG: hypothetical protein A2504_01370 [Bdellovibrionales bacterium RIFOXYD12_FULL_39_22]|nr:MAG: hypothetical protein A2385_02260 [Bdellovibrionales bacterium RIFOXYB1_FULL_39_21]OFZ42756.1 MAG: hypothetical protein A2485_10445 [Bdellovibrionales bacterium RIFOXYC12_FULL_39_17]OFZ47315.1 MAG: hypothetical protein A2404_15050 [Bdellovibrionales bacterium RIFOXYC1_FULL_39_130]OFZ75481.1 MAG: hypothetical protein A2560_04320 [Bdellovibrionales bacterium RIFOXYD1_FULL_39_84]OFZ93435.1 MAG: hypothetical protein A2504_01370 [Bdellovibrionales bacterium RIFOXYD12_FULL_39_22]HLE12410.1 ef